MQERTKPSPAPKFCAPRGFALAYFLLVSALIAMCTGAVLVLGKEGLRASRGGVDANRSLYAAEAGLAQAIAELERNPAWTEGFDKFSMPNNTSRYHLKFATSPSDANERESVNNILGNTPTDSYRGPDTVPPHSALLIVEGRSGLGTVTIEALVVAGLNVLAGDALTATGQITLGGEVTVKGQTSLANTTAVPADLHSNSTETGPRMLYLPTGSGGLEVSGNLTSSSDEAASTVFDLGGAGLPSSKLRSNVPEKALPRPNIQAMVGEQAGHPGPAISTTPGALPLSGNNHYSGDVTINGDVDLVDNAGLYVDGNLTINGSLRGRGTVVVTGNSNFYGDSDVGFRENDYVSLLSGGHVVLKGFKGQQYMDGLAVANPTITKNILGPDAWGPDHFHSPNYPLSLPADLAWTNLQLGLRGIQERVSVQAATIDEHPLQTQEHIQAEDHLIDAYQSVVSHHAEGAVREWDPSGTSDLLGAQPRTHNNAGALRDYMADQGGSRLSAPHFLHQRFQLLGDIFRRGQTDREGEATVSLPPWVSPPQPHAFGFFYYYDDWDPLEGGIFDAMQSEPPSSFADREQEVKELVQAIQQFDIDRLGSAHFKGIVYSNGAFVATDDVVVQGTVIVNGNPYLDPLELNLGGTLGVRTFRPGDVGLFGHTALVYVEEFFHDGVHNLAGGGTLGVQRWVSR